MAPRLTGQRVGVRAIIPPDVPALYALASEEDIGYRWRFHGPTPPFEAFAAGLNDGVLAQMVGVDKVTGAVLGHVSAYNPDLRSGHAYLATVVAQGHIGDAIGTEMSLLFVRDLLQRWPLRKLYIEMPSFNLDGLREHLGPLVGTTFTSEAVLSEHTYFAGQYWDHHILSATRNTWLDLANGWLG